MACEGCGAPLPPGRRRWCSDRCCDRGAKARVRALIRALRADGGLPIAPVDRDDPKPLPRLHPVPEVWSCNGCGQLLAGPSKCDVCAALRAAERPADAGEEAA